MQWGPETGSALVGRTTALHEHWLSLHDIGMSHDRGQVQSRSDGFEPTCSRILPEQSVHNVTRISMSSSTHQHRLDEGLRRGMADLAFERCTWLPAAMHSMSECQFIRI